MTVLDATPLLSADTSTCAEKKKRALLDDPMEEAADPVHDKIDPATEYDFDVKKEKKQLVASKKQKAAPKQSTGPTRGRRKSRWKLKFHHQALPPEYLKHYKQQEKKRRLTENNNKKLAAMEKLKVKKTANRTGESVSSGLDSPLPVEAILQTGPDADSDELKFLDLESPQLEPEEAKNEDKRLEPKREQIWPSPNFLGDGFPHLNIDLSQNKAFLENLLSNQIEINRVDRTEPPPPVRKTVKAKKPKAIPSSGRIMNYSDLPYMGEITLDGIKPRRGRKPKKADICHLIYKNYGQVFPGAPNTTPEETTPKPPKIKAPPRVPPVSTVQRSKFQAESPLPTVSGLINHTDVQNRIINSLLERRLTQENRIKLEAGAKATSSLEEPLNLCLKDLQSLKIKLSRKHGNIYETKSQEPSPKPELEVKKEVIDVESDDESSVDDVDLTPFNLVTTELRDSSDDDSCVSLGSHVTLTKLPEKSPPPQDAPMIPSPESMMYWPGNNCFYPPMPMLPDMYYQRLNAMKQQTPEKKPMKPKTKSPARRLLPKGSPAPGQAIAKRKRSAIFIPPVPPENTTNPTTEVSICKFKFTGGAKPSLQEKKMLSVDSGGNFRYYSGTGDKSMRGYEYFPRESLQQCQENTGCSPSGVFLTASALGSGEKIPEDVGHSGFFDASFPIQVTKPEAKNSKRKRLLEPRPGFPPLGDQTTDSLDGDDDEDDDSEQSLGTAGSPTMDLQRVDDPIRDEDGRRGRKSRKSLAREKLEQTFKEKGFLIQTQHLESAEGATYCKFRQLRKFTRYLFRSWKDYLPGNVRDLSADAGVGAQGEPSVPPVKLELPDK